MLRQVIRVALGEPSLPARIIFGRVNARQASPGHTRWISRCHSQNERLVRIVDAEDAHAAPAHQSTTSRRPTRFFQSGERKLSG
jgi:hypothetical protein